MIWIKKKVGSFHFGNISF